MGKNIGRNIIERSDDFYFKFNNFSHFKLIINLEYPENLKIDKL